VTPLAAPCIPRSLLLAALGATLVLAPLGPALAASRVVFQQTEGTVHPVADLRTASTGIQRSGTAVQTGDTVWVFRDSLETWSSPSNEGGWTHADASGQPAAWHIDTALACQGHAFWCGRIDSSWVNDPDRMGYDNSWDQTLENFADLSGVSGPYTISFKSQLDCESGFDYAYLEVFDPDFSWTVISFWTGIHHGNGGAPCDTFTVQVPDSIVAKGSTLQFRFRFTSDIQGSAADGIYTGDGWVIDNVTVKAGTSDLRFFDDFEFGMGTWTVSQIPPVGDRWRIAANQPAEQLCKANTSKVWTVTNPVTGSLTPDMDDKLMSRAIATGHADQVVLAFDVYRNLPSLSCFYYGVQIRTRNLGGAWSTWSPASSQLYFGTEREWMRQLVSLPGAAAKDSVQCMIDMKDYSDVFCDGVSTSGGTVAYFDNFALGTIGLAPPSIVAAEQDLFQDTFQTAPFFADDNFNTPRGDSVSVRLSASRGLKQATFFYRLNGGSFIGIPLVPFGATIPTAYSADVPAGTYSRGTQVAYYFSVTDSLNDVATLPSDAVSASHYYTATVLPAIQAASGSCPGDTAKILYVNHSLGVDGGAAMSQSLTALGVRFDRYDVNAPASALGNAPGGSPAGDPIRRWPAVPVATLGMYAGIIWDVGDRASGTISAEDQMLLQAWLARPGSNRGLLLAGDNVAYDLSVNGQDIGTFLNCTLGTTYSKDIWENTPQDSLTPTLRGAVGTRIAAEALPIDGQCPSVNRFDGLAVNGCAGSKARSWITYPNTVIASVEKRDSVGVVADTTRSILLGFTLDAMPSTSRRNFLLYRTMVQEFEIPGCYVATGVDPEVAAAAPGVRARLYDAAPNPFNPWTSIRFELPHAARVELHIFDVAGARVRKLVGGPLEAGPHEVTWDGKDDRGRNLASGAYFYRLSADGDAQAKKLILLR